ncbi:hypothetical protein JNW90_10635 [Micromonospora sp. STR1s_5]|nr:hypothetical protein [Micromonospora sp. STR1s_5]
MQPTLATYTRRCGHCRQPVEVTEGTEQPHDCAEAQCLHCQPAPPTARCREQGHTINP